MISRKTPPNRSINLFQDASAMDLNIYLLKYASISDTLIQKGALSTLDRVNRFLDGLSEKLRERALEVCTKEGRRLSSHQTGLPVPYILEPYRTVANRGPNACACQCMVQIVYMPNR